MDNLKVMEHLPPTRHVRPALERTLKDLRLDYLDLISSTSPIAQKFVPSKNATRLSGY